MSPHVFRGHGPRALQYPLYWPTPLQIVPLLNLPSIILTGAAHLSPARTPPNPNIYCVDPEGQAVVPALEKPLR